MHLMREEFQAVAGLFETGVKSWIALQHARPPPLWQVSVGIQKCTQPTTFDRGQEGCRRVSRNANQITGYQNENILLF